MHDDVAERPRYLTIHDMPTSERPRERLRDYGPAAVSNAELLAIVWRTGTAKQSVLELAAQAISQFGSLAAIRNAGHSQLMTIRGVGEAKALELQAAIELGRRTFTLSADDRLTIRSPGDVANFCVPEMRFLEQEQLRVILLSTKNQVIGRSNLYQGSLNRSIVRVAEVFRDAIRQSAASVIVVHNHPSGDPTPSPEDIRVTTELVSAGRLLDVEVLDHVVIGGEKWISMKERSLGFGG